jgi:hypothetical protein
MMKHFQPYEIVDKQTFEKMGDDALSLFNPEALIALDDLREFFDKPITVNNWHEVKGGFQWRGFRTPEKAAELGSPKSQHAQGNAFDCDIRGYTAEQARIVIQHHKDDPLLCRIMRMEAKVPWLHFDLKPVENRIYVFKG